MDNSKRILNGQYGEGFASTFLQEIGWKIIDRNHRRKSDELDIIAKSKEGTLIFVEVKSMVKGGLLMPEDNLSPAKTRKINRAAQFYARQHPELIDEDLGWRIDLIAVDLDAAGHLLDIRHYENI